MALAAAGTEWLPRAGSSLRAAAPRRVPRPPAWPPCCRLARHLTSRTSSRPTRRCGRGTKVRRHRPRHVLQPDSLVCDTLSAVAVPIAAQTEPSPPPASLVPAASAPWEEAGGRGRRSPRWYVLNRTSRGAGRWGGPRGGRGSSGPVSSVQSLCSADTWVKAKLFPAPQLGASHMGQGRRPPLGSLAVGRIVVASPHLPKWPAPRLLPLLGRDPHCIPSLSPGWQLWAGEVWAAPSSSLEETAPWLLADPLPLLHAPGASSHRPDPPSSGPAGSPGSPPPGAYEPESGSEPVERVEVGPGQSRPEQVPAPHGCFYWLCPQGQLRESRPAGALPGACGTLSTH